MKGRPASATVVRLIGLLNKKYLHLELEGIRFREYEPDDGDLHVAWVDPRNKVIFIDTTAFPSSGPYGAFILAHEVAHIRLQHVDKVNVEEEELQASMCARFAIAGSVGPGRAKRLMERWANEWLVIIEKGESAQPRRPFRS